MCLLFHCNWSVPKYIVFLFLFLTSLVLSTDEIKPTVTKGMVIDAGSGGSRLHVFSWKPRIFNQVPPPISYPESDERWTARIDPGISQYSNNLELISNHLAPLIDFAKLVLAGYEHEFKDFPIYFKATGGMRELNLVDREKVMERVRNLLSDKTFCPFYFQRDFARVISGNIFEQSLQFSSLITLHA